MRIFIGFLMLLRVSGDRKVNVKGFLNENVLLPCDCEDRTSDDGPRWQKETEINLNNSPSYADRIELFPTDSSNCSILLKNIRETDHGTYRCIYEQKVYEHILVHLSVCDLFKPSQDSFIGHNGLRTFSCKVKNCNNQTELQWTLDGQTLENSPKYQISSNRNESDGIFHFTNTLTLTESEIKSDSKPECSVSSPNQQLTSTGLGENSSTNISSISVTIIFVGLILGVGLLLVWCYRKNISCRKQQPV